MGISGLLPALREVTRPCHIRDLEGLVVGVDTYCWLHKALHTCATELCRGERTERWILFILDRVDLLLKHGAKPFLVFDGDRLPAKAGKELERSTRREKSRQAGMQCLRQGSPGSAHAHFTKAVDVTPAMAAQLISVLREYRPGVQFVVAPYEADAQLGYLYRTGAIDAVITEDSDLLLFGCQRVLFKLQRTGEADEVNLGHAFSTDIRNSQLDLRGKSHDHLLLTCILSGCDYLQSVPGMGLKTAHRLTSTYRVPERLVKALRQQFGASVPRDYDVSFFRAVATFRHQVVFDPKARCAVHMEPLPEAHTLGIDTSFLGTLMSDAVACQIADGLLDPISREPFRQLAADDPATTAREAVPRMLSLSGGRISLKVPKHPKKLIQQRTLKSFFKPIIATPPPPAKRAKTGQSYGVGHHLPAPLSPLPLIDGSRDNSLNQKDATTGARPSPGSRPGISPVPGVLPCIYDFDSTPGSAAESSAERRLSKDGDGNNLRLTSRFFATKLRGYSGDGKEEEETVLSSSAMTAVALAMEEVVAHDSHCDILKERSQRVQQGEAADSLEEPTTESLAPCHGIAGENVFHLFAHSGNSSSLQSVAPLKSVS